VRELRNVVERLLLFPDRPDAALAQAGLASGTDDLSRLDFNEARRRWQERFESIYLANLLQSCGGVVSKAAERAGISRQTLHRLINKLGIDK
jgi:two-component system response regulator AtoC